MLNRIILYSLQYRIQVLIFAFLFAAAGAASLPNLHIGLLPDLNRDTVTVLVEAPKLAAEEIDLLVIRQIESSLRGASNVEIVRSISGNGYATVRAGLAWRADANRARMAIQERLIQLQPSLPRNVAVSLAPPESVMGEIMLVGLTIESPTDGGGGADVNEMDARATADWRVRPRLLAVPGVQQVTVWGGRVKQYQILADPERLRLYELTYDDVAGALANGGTDAGAGLISDGKREFSVRAVSRAESTEQLEGSLIAMHGSHPVRLRDVAEVRVGPAPARGCASVDGKPAIILAIQKMPDASTLQVTTALGAALAKLADELPRGMKVRGDLFSQSTFIERGIGNVSSAFRDGSILVVVVLILFLADLRAAAASLIALPLSMLFTALVFSVLGLPIDLMSLGGVALACGELVDDAIIDAENIRRRLQGSAGSSSVKDVVFSASSEIRGAVVLGTAAVLLACAPLMALSGLEGRLFRPLLTSYLISIVMSFLVSLTVTPALASLLFSEYMKSTARSESVVLRGCKRLAKYCYSVAFARPRWVLAGTVLLAAFCVSLLLGMRREFLPPFNEGALTVHVLCHPGIALEESDRRAAQAEELIRGIKGVKSTLRRTGRTEGDEHAEGVHFSEIDVVLDNGARPQTEIVAETRQRLKGLPGAAIGISQPMTHRIDHLLAGERTQISVEIKGPDYAVLDRLAGQVRLAMRTVKGVVDLQQDEQVMTPRISFQVDREAAARFGFEPGVLAETIQTLVSGKNVGRMSSDSAIFDMVLWTPEKNRRDASALGDISIVSPTGAQVRLSDVAAIREGFGPSRIDRDNGSRIRRVTCNLDSRDLNGSVRAIQQILPDRSQLPAGYAIVVQGEYEAQQRASREMLFLGAVALIAIFAMLWLHFRSAGLALQIMMNVPFAFSGGVLALWVANEPLSLAAIVGFISLAGVAVRNGVLMISHYGHLLNNEGMPFGREMVERGSQERVAPVLMTAACAGGALCPLILNPTRPGTEMLYPVALVVVGGLAACVLLDFAVTPVLFLNFFSGRKPRAFTEKAT